MKTQYSEQQKAEALAALDANGGNVSGTAKALGIPRVTLLQWRDGRGVSEDVSQIRHHVKEALSDRIEELLGVIVGEMKEKVSTAKFSELSFGLDKATHAMQLLRGEPTSINRDDSLTDEQRVEELAALADAARARAGGQPAPEPAPVN